MPIFWRTGRNFDSLIDETRSPSTVTDPLVGCSSALIMRTSVDLPAPEYPMMPKMSPASMLNDTSSTARIGCLEPRCRNSLLTWSNTMIGSLVCVIILPST